MPRTAGRWPRTCDLTVYEKKVKVDPPTQAEARRVRYLALEQMAKDSGADRIATGHTADDQAETVVLRLDRGGYGMGIPPVRGAVIRPLLDLRRRDTESVCRRAGIEFCMDPSNKNPKYRRIAVRARLAGASDAEIGRLTAAADEAWRSTQAVAQRVEVLWPGISTTSDREVRIARRRLQQTEEPVKQQLVRRAAVGMGLELTNQVVKDILRKVVPVTGARLALPGGLSVWSERKEVVIRSLRTAENAAPGIPEDARDHNPAGMGSRAKPGGLPDAARTRWGPRSIHRAGRRRSPDRRNFGPTVAARRPVPPPGRPGYP